MEIVSADAFTVYRGLSIGTAKPGAAQLDGVPHHLIDVVDVQDEFNVAQFVKLAEQSITDILNRGRTPLVVGGTGFYVSALIRGLPLTPPSVLPEREAVERELDARGLDALLSEIEALNPAEAQRMERNPRRVVRALEVYRRTGRFPGEFGYSQPAFQYVVTAFTRPAAELEERMTRRIQVMLNAGWQEEALWLASQLDPATLPRPTVWQALGYREALALARGELGESEAREQIFLATRQYAKRQLTWMRSQLGVEILGVQAARARMQARLKNS